MRRDPAIRILLVAVIVSVCGVECWLARRTPSVTPSHPPATQVETSEAQLSECLGHPADQAVERLHLGEAEWHWTDEPPGILRGVTYFPSDGRQVTLYIAEGEPLFRKFSDRFEWDYGAFLRCRVGGIQYKSGGIHLDIGPAVPWQWRQP